MNQTQDLAIGSIGKLLVKLAVPSITAQIINMLYNIVDRMYIGHIEGIGKTALTGVGLTFPIIMVISAFSCLIGMGGAPNAAIKMGQGKNEEAEKILGNCVTMIGIMSFLLTVILLIFRLPLLELFGASENTIVYADEYLSIYLIGTVFVQVALGLNSFINTQGFAKVGMLTVVIGAVINIVLDPILIFGLGLGVKGAAIATIVSQAVSAIWVFKFLVGTKTTLKIKKEHLKLNKNVIFPVLALGMSPFIMQSTESLINIVFNKSLFIYGSAIGGVEMGDMAVGTMTIMSSVLMIITMPLSGLSQGAQPIISYNYGAGNMDRVRNAFKLLFVSCLGLTTFLWAVVMIFPTMFVSLFNNDSSLTAMTVWGMRIYLAMIFAFGAQSACQQTFLALGKAKISIFLALLRKVFLLIPLAFILPFSFGLQGVYLAEPIADIIAATTTVVCFTIFYKKHLHDV